MTKDRLSSTRGRSVRVVAAGLTVVTGILLIGLAVMIADNQDDGRDALDSRFSTRASLTADFARDYIEDIAERERDQARRLLAGAGVTQADFEQVVASFGFEAAVLLDAEGRLMQVWPSRPELLGRKMTDDYAHLRTAVSGGIGVSEVVPSAARGIPITAVAVPYDTPFGRRVISGAFSPETSPLGDYMSSVVPVAGGVGTLIDQSGNILAGGAGIDRGARFAERSDGIVRFEAGGVSTTAAIASVEGTPWRVVLTAPTKRLHGPLEGAGTWTAWALLGTLAGFAAVCIGLLLRLGDARAQAALLSRTDVLTGLPNRRAMTDALDRAIAHSRRSDEPLAVCIVDLDHFKSINDTHGHETGDTVLSTVAATLAAATRQEDLAGRWGGEEFLVLLTNADADGAATAAERIRCAVSEAPLASALDGATVTASLGVAVLEDTDTPITLVSRSDAALFEAKAAGRNRVVVSPSALGAAAGG